MKYTFVFLALGIVMQTVSPGQESPVELEEFIYEKAPYKSCHAPTLAQTETGLAAAWFGGTHEKHMDVEIWFSKKQEGTWKAPASVANGIVKDKRFPCWNPVLFFTSDKTLYLFYKVGPSPSEWWGMMKYSTDDGKSWSNEVRLPEGILGPIKNKPVLIDNKVLLCPSSTEHNGWKVQMEFFYLNKKNWDMPVKIDPSSAFNAIQPTILKHKNGSLQILCRSKEGYIVTSTSQDQGKTWNDLRPTSLPNPNSGIDAITLKNGRHLLVYNHTGTPKGKWGGNRYPLNIALSDNGINWNASIVLEQEEGEYSYPAVIQSNDGKVHVIYTWKRLKIKHVVLDIILLPEYDIDIWNQ
jgi:alpha-L-rhamnosidase